MSPHEMKTPLQVISGYAELMANGLVPPRMCPGSPSSFMRNPRPCAR